MHFLHICWYLPTLLSVKVAFEPWADHGPEKPKVNLFSFKQRVHSLEFRVAENGVLANTTSGIQQRLIMLSVSDSYCLDGIK